MRRHLTANCRVGFVSIGVLILVAGCLGRSPNVRLFTLGSQVQLERSERAPDLAVLIGPVRLPSYLERPQIARRLGGGEVELDEFNRWVGGFEENLIRALTDGVRPDSMKGLLARYMPQRMRVVISFIAVTQD